jgi:DNA polymerase-3 subunit epsilon
VHTHLSNESSRRSIEMKSNIANIDWERTGNELIALLLESDEIKKHKPKYNRAQRRSAINFGLYYSHNKDGYIEFAIKKNSESEEIPLTTFNNQKEAKNRLHSWAEELNLCHKLSGLYQSAGACFYHGLGECKGACIGEESVESYNFRAQHIVDKLSYNHDSFLVIENGRDAYEKAVIKVSHGKYIGFGYIDKTYFENRYFELLNDCVKQYPDTRDTRMILKSYLERKKPMIMDITSLE